MHAIRFQTTRQLVARLCARTRHAEPQLHAKRKPARLAASARVKVIEDELKRCLYSPLHMGVDL